MRLLLTTTSYQDTPGSHHALLSEQGYDIQFERGPLTEKRLLGLAGDFDAFLCGDDEITARVIRKSLPRLRVISKYGVGLDKIDLAECSRHKLPVLYTPGVNQVAVAEHAFALMLSLSRHLITTINDTRQGQWRRSIGHELFGRKLGIVGLGAIGREVAKRAHAFGMEVHAFTRHWPEAFAKEYDLVQYDTLDSMLPEIDLLTLHAGLSDSTRDLINLERLTLCQPHLLLINTARAELVKTSDLIAALDNEIITAYATDVLENEPPEPQDPILTHPKILVTPHIGSRTYESMPRQAMRATLNLINYLKGDLDYIQANHFKYD